MNLWATPLYFVILLLLFVKLPFTRDCCHSQEYENPGCFQSATEAPSHSPEDGCVHLRLPAGTLTWCQGPREFLQLHEQQQSVLWVAPESCSAAILFLVYTSKEAIRNITTYPSKRVYQIREKIFHSSLAQGIKNSMIYSELPTRSLKDCRPALVLMTSMLKVGCVVSLWVPRAQSHTCPARPCGSTADCVMAREAADMPSQLLSSGTSAPHL